MNRSILLSLLLTTAVAAEVIPSNCQAQQNVRSLPPLSQRTNSSKTASSRQGPNLSASPNSAVQRTVFQTDSDDLLAPNPLQTLPAERSPAPATPTIAPPVSPYPVPDFSGPAEKVVPLPIEPAPDTFRGFDQNGTTGVAPLPEPRRVYPLPRVAVPSPPAEISTEEQLQLDFSGSSFPSLLSGGYASGQTYAMPNTVMQNSAMQSSVMPNLSCGPNRPLTRLASRVTAPLANAADSNGFCATPNNAPCTVPSTNACGPDFQQRMHSRNWQLANRLPCNDMNYRNDLAPPSMANNSCLVPYEPGDFCPDPINGEPLDPCKEIETYYGKLPVDVQRPWVEWWRPLYTGGMYDPSIPVFSDVNPLTPSFLVYGDYRTGVGVHRNNGKDVRNWAHRLNLDMDLRLTGTERFHAFTGPLDHNGRFTRLDFSNNDVEFEEELDAQFDTAFFEGDLGAITGSIMGEDAPFDLPFTCGLVPLLYQNGVWMEDAIAGFAVGKPWQHSRALNWSNYEATFFAGFNQVTTPAFNNDNNAGSVFGSAWFIEAYNGYIEADYAYLNDLDGLNRDYHNAAIAYTRRYFGRISNSIRLIGNIGQDGPQVTRTADGGLILFENSLITAQPSNFVPYFNLFAGFGRPQSVARAGGAGGILRNTGINFETDGLTGYPTLDATGSNAYGGAVGVNLLSADFRKQWIVEFAAQDTYGDPAISAAAGPQYGIGTRWQKAINNRSLWRVDLMNAWLDNAPDIYGTRTEFRWKF